jgi:hypothetical protein
VRVVRCGCGILTVAALAAALLGCGQKPTGPERGVVHGKVTLDGKPIVEGSINFVPVPAGAGPAWTTAFKDGQYLSDASGPVVGKNRVEILAPRNVTGKPRRPRSDRMGPEDDYVECIPPRYNTQSILDVDVRPGGNTFDFELKSR